MHREFLELLVCLCPNAGRRLFVQKFCDAEIALQLQMRPMIEWIADCGRYGSGVSQEFIVIAGVAGNKSLRHSIGAHRSPFVMIPVAALSEPDLRQVSEAFISGDVRRRNVAMIIENGQWLSELEIQLFAGRSGEQKILGKKGFVHGYSQVGVLALNKTRRRVGQVVRPRNLT